MKIEAAGIYTDFPIDDYHLDPTPTPSLTQSIAKVLIERSPAHARIAHPRLNPDYEPDDPTKYDIGNIAHALLLGRGKQIVVVEGFDDWRKKDAQAVREDAKAAGKLAVLAKHYEVGVKMAAVALDTIITSELDWEDGDSEVVIAWQTDALWNRAMIDRLSKDRRSIFDLKTTGQSAAPQSLGVKMATDGWDVQAAQHEAGLDALDPDNAGRRAHYFICQESDPPFAVSIARLPESALTLGRKKLAYARSLWTEAMTTNVWPAYSTEIASPSYPPWAEARWLDREIAESERKPTNLLMAG